MQPSAQAFRSAPGFYTFAVVGELPIVPSATVCHQLAGPVVKRSAVYEYDCAAVRFDDMPT